MDIRDLNDDDVVLVKTFQGMQKQSEFVTRVRDNLGTQLKTWLDQGTEIEFLRVAGGGWQKGTIRLRLEIIPDEPEPNSLDALREELRQADKFPPVD